MRRSDALLSAAACVLLAPGIVLAAADLFPLPPQIDFAAYYLAARALRGGMDPYDPSVLAELASSTGIADYTPYLYPPLLAVIITPLTALPYHIAAAVWLALSTAALVGALALLKSLVETRDRAFPFIVAAVFVFPPVNHTLELGQINHFLLLLIAGAVMAPRTPVAGALIGIAAAIKVFPAAIGGLFVATRNFRAIAALILAGTAVTGASIAAPTSHRALREWIHVLPQINEQRLITPNNQSVSAVFARLLSPHRFEGFTSGPDARWIELEPVVQAPRLAPIAAVVAASLIIVVTALAIIRSRTAKGAPARAAHTGVIIAALLMVMPVVWDHYYVLLLVPLAALYGRASRAHLHVAAVGVLLLLAHRYWRLTIYLGSPILLSAGLAGTFLIWTALVRHLRAIPDIIEVSSKGV